MNIDMEAIVRAFVIESKDKLDEMEALLIELESSMYPADRLNDICRIAHTLRANSGMLGYDCLSNIITGMEEALARLRNGDGRIDSDAVTLLLRGVDACRQILPSVVAGSCDMQPEHWELLGDMAEGKSGSQAAPASYNGEDRRRRPFGRRREDYEAWVDNIKTIRVDTERLDQILVLVSEVAASGKSLAQMTENAGEYSREEIDMVAQFLDSAQRELRAVTLNVRLTPLGPALKSLIRMAHDTAGAHGKSVQLSINGDDLEIDNSMVEPLKDGLTHLLRNAIDHGIELPETRKKLRKDPCGHIDIQAYQTSDELVVQVSDDGSGFDLERILSHARRIGLAGPNESLTDSEIIAFVFQPGFTTDDMPGDLSGRGFGLDVVRRSMESLAGFVTIESRPGEGSLISISVPSARRTRKDEPSTAEITGMLGSKSTTFLLC